MDQQLTIFRTDLGWLGLLGRGRTVERISIGHACADEVRERIARELPDGWHEARWWPELQRRLTEYASGAADDFRDVEIAPEGRTTDFQRRVVRELRRIGYGRTVSYGELATLAGAPRAARAVGTIMSHNRVPLIVPCHRVIAAGGKLGGFSAPQGTSLKRRLLDLEAAEVDREHSAVSAKGKNRR